MTVPMSAHVKKLELPVRKHHSPPSHNSKTVLSTVHVGGSEAGLADRARSAGWLD